MSDEQEKAGEEKAEATEEEKAEAEEEKAEATEEEKAEAGEEKAEEAPLTWRGRLGRLVAIIVISEVTCYLILLLSASLVSVPIVRVSTIYEEQSDLIRRLLKTGETRRIVIDKDLGWALRPGPIKEGFHTGKQGARADRHYDPKPPEGVFRMTAYGDSFVFGDEVLYNEAWSVLVEKERSDVEVLNYGVSGYGTDQALLAYRRDGRKMAPKLVIMGFAPTDMRRSVNVYRRFISTHDEVLGTKPRFRLADGDKLELIPPPIGKDEDWKPFLDDPSRTQELGANDYYYEPLVYENPLYDWSATVRLVSAGWARVQKRLIDDDRIYIKGTQFNTESEAFRLQVAILKQFAEEVRAAGARPVVLLFPDHLSVKAVMNGQSHNSQVLLNRIADSVDVWDPTPAFAEAAKEDSVMSLFNPGFHYSKKGNRVMAKWVVQQLPAPAK